MLTLRVVVANGVPRGEAEDSSRRALDSGTADLGGVLPDNLGEVTVEVNVHLGGGVLLAIESPVGHLIVVPLVGNTTSSSLVLESINVAGSTPGSEVLAVTAIALVPIQFISQNVIRCTSINLHVVLEDTTVGSVLGVAGELIVPLKSGGRVVRAVDVVVGKHDGVVGTLERKARGVDASFNSDLGLGTGGGRLDDLLDGSLSLLDNWRRGLVNRRGSGRLHNDLLSILILLNNLGGRLRVDPDSDDFRLSRLFLDDRLGSLLLDNDRSRSRSGLLLDDLDNFLGDLGSLGGLIDSCGVSSLLGLSTLSDDDGDNLVDPFGLHGTLLESVSDGAGRGQNGASADHKQRCLHDDR
jgi:hypothetical protein